MSDLPDWSQNFKPLIGKKIADIKLLPRNSDGTVWPCELMVDCDDGSSFHVTINQPVHLFCTGERWSRTFPLSAEDVKSMREMLGSKQW